MVSAVFDLKIYDTLYGTLETLSELFNCIQAKRVDEHDSVRVIGLVSYFVFCYTLLEVTVFISYGTKMPATVFSIAARNQSIGCRHIHGN